MNRREILLENKDVILQSVRNTLRSVSEQNKKLTEGDTSASTDAETILSILMSNQNLTRNEFESMLEENGSDAVFLKNYFDTHINKGKIENVFYEAIVQIKKEKLQKNVQQSGAKSYQTTDIWKSYGGINKTASKADIISQSTTYSVKNASTQVRVLDASAPQIIALIFSAMDNTGETDEIKSKVKENLDAIKDLSNQEGSKLSRMYGDKKLNLGDIRKINDQNIKNLVKQYDENTEKLNKEINYIFNKVQSSKDFKHAFIFESLSGKIMFGKTSLGRADYIITWTQDFSVIKNHEISDVTDKVVNTFNIPKFASKSSGQRVSKTIQMFFKEGIETIQNSTKNKLDYLCEQERLLNKKLKSGVITEGAFSDLWHNIKEKGVEIISKMVNAIKEFIQTAYKKLTGSIKDLLNFLGITISIGDYSLYANLSYGDL
jgi:hypothetical protein